MAILHGPSVKVDLADTPGAAPPLARRAPRDGDRVARRRCCRRWRSRSTAPASSWSGSPRRTASGRAASPLGRGSGALPPGRSRHSWRLPTVPTRSTGWTRWRRCARRWSGSGGPRARPGRARSRAVGAGGACGGEMHGHGEAERCRAAATASLAAGHGGAAGTDGLAGPAGCHAGAGRLQACAIGLGNWLALHDRAAAETAALRQRRRGPGPAGRSARPLRRPARQAPRPLRSQADPPGSRAEAARGPDGACGLPPTPRPCQRDARFLLPLPLGEAGRPAGAVPRSSARSAPAAPPPAPSLKGRGGSGPEPRWPAPAPTRAAPASSTAASATPAAGPNPSAPRPSALPPRPAPPPSRQQRVHRAAGRLRPGHRACHRRAAARAAGGTATGTTPGTGPGTAGTGGVPAPALRAAAAAGGAHWAAGWCRCRSSRRRTRCCW